MSFQFGKSAVVRGVTLFGHMVFLSANLDYWIAKREIDGK
jgi:hypothetical protein